MSSLRRPHSLRSTVADETGRSPTITNEGNPAPRCRRGGSAPHEVGDAPHQTTRVPAASAQGAWPPPNRRPHILTVAVLCVAAYAGCGRTERSEPASPAASDTAKQRSSHVVTGAPSSSPEPSELPRSQPEPPPATSADSTGETPADSAAGDYHCPGWQVNALGRAIGSLERFCQEFAPCPKALRDAGDLGFFGTLPKVEVFTSGIIVLYGSESDGRRFAFTSKGKLVGASIWQERTFGACRKKAIEYVGGAIPEPAETEQVQACGYVPGRDLRTEKACKCQLPTDRSPLVGLDRGPTLQLPLDCLYELGAAGRLCQTTLDSQRGMPDAKESTPGCGWTLVSSPLMSSDCVYDRKGQLVEMRLGQRYLSTGFDAPCRP